MWFDCLTTDVFVLLFFFFIFAHLCVCVFSKITYHIMINKGLLHRKLAINSNVLWSK